MKKPRKLKSMFTTENGLPANVYYSFEGMPRKRANKLWKLCQEDNRTHSLFVTSHVCLVELVADGTAVYLIYDMSNITHAEVKLAKNLMRDFNHIIELAHAIIYNNRIHSTYSRAGQLIMEALKKGISPDINALLKPADSRNDKVQG